MTRANGFFQRPNVQGLVAFAVYFAVVAIIALLLRLFVNLSFGSAFNIAFLTILALYTLVSLSQLVFVRPRAGQVLLDLGPPSSRNLYIALVALYVLAGLFSLISQQNLALWVKSQASTLIFAAFWTVLFFGRLQVCQNGIWLQTSLLPWHKLRSYRWQNGTLHFETKGSWLLSFWLPKSFVVPEKHVEALETHLLEHGVPERTAESVAPA